MVGAPQSSVEERDVVIIGAGFAGLYALHRARDVLGLAAVVIEAGDGVGGTWYWNRYPGARCDSESWYYCYSFCPDLLREWRWSSRYPEQPEILRYLEHVADRFDLRRDIRFGERVVNARFDEADLRWTVTTSSGAQVRTQFVISAVGCLSATNLPSITGLDDFGGERHHTARWPHEGVDFAGRRVGLIGTGSTGIQATPVIAEAAEHLTVFQRTANYSVPARNRPLEDADIDAIRAEYESIWARARQSFAGFPYEMSDRSALEVPDDERRAVFESLWDEGGFRFLWGSFYDLLLDERANATAVRFIAEKIRATVDDPAVAETLVPKDHPYGSKRPPIDTGYYETFNRDNVTLVDLRRTPLERVTPAGVLTTADHHDLDVLVFATGFDAVTGAITAIDIRGRGGVSIADHWADGPRTYLGLQTAGFPNLFLVTGPQSPSVLANMPVAIEQHIEWITDCINDLRQRGDAAIEATDTAEAEWVAHAASLADGTLFARARSWYLGANVPGKQRVFLPYVGGMPGYRARCDAVRAAGYPGFTVTGSR
jgi:cation diffusion facilitator CzcD-associated flavoprotein CzcO